MIFVKSPNLQPLEDAKTAIKVSVGDYIAVSVVDERFWSNEIGFLLGDLMKLLQMATAVSLLGIGATFQNPAILRFGSFGLCRRRFWAWGPSWTA